MKTLHIPPYPMYITDKQYHTVRVMANHRNQTLEWQRKFTVDGLVKWATFQSKRRGFTAKSRPHSRRDT